MRYIVERRNAWGNRLFAILDTQAGEKVVARCESGTDAAYMAALLNSAPIGEVLS